MAGGEWWGKGHDGWRGGWGEGGVGEEEEVSVKCWRV